MKCGYCGTENSQNSNFCGKCGAEFDKIFRCSHCGEELPKKSKYCIYCGAKVKTGQAASVRAPRQENRAHYVNKRKKPSVSRKPRLTKSNLIGYVVVIVIVFTSHRERSPNAILAYASCFHVSFYSCIYRMRQNTRGQYKALWFSSTV